MTQSFEHSSAVEPIRIYFHRVRAIIFSPRSFFHKMPISGGASGPLAFALVTHWLATAVAHFWKGLIGEQALSVWGKLLGLFNQDKSIDSIGRLPWFHHSRDIVMDWFWHAGPIVIDPFLTLGKIILMSMVIFMGARVVVPARAETSGKVTYESVLRILCYTVAADLIAVVPFVGSPLTWLFRLILMVVGMSEIYRIGTGRALVIALFPILIIAGMLSVAMLGSAALVIQMLMGS